MSTYRVTDTRAEHIAPAKTPAPLFGYMRLPLAGSAPGAMAEQLEELARARGGSVWGRVFCQPGSPARDLWALLEAFDQETGESLTTRLASFAQHRHIDLRRLLNAAPPTSALWALLDNLAQSDAEYVLVPSPEHLEGLGVPKQVLLRLISRVTAAQVVFADTQMDERRCRLIAEIQVPATPSAQEAAALRIRERLLRSGFADIVETVLTLTRIIVADIVQTGAAAARRGEPDQVHVKVRCLPDTRTVTVEFAEAHTYTGEPISPALRQVCAASGDTIVRRFAGVDGRTVTRCTVPRPQPQQPQQPQTAEPSMAELAEVVHRYVAARGSCPLPDWVPELPDGRQP